VALVFPHFLAARAARQNAPFDAKKARLTVISSQHIARAQWLRQSRDRRRISRTPWDCDIATHQRGFGFYSM
jgi:hypothetical protein